MERRKVRLTIKATLTLAIGLTTALLILGVGIFSYYNTARVVEDAVIREARLVAEKNAEPSLNGLGSSKKTCTFSRWFLPSGIWTKPGPSWPS